MKKRPILFSAPMVRAILDGSKTQTRRVAKGEVLQWLEREKFSPAFVADAGNHLCPYGQPGDRLWVREGHYLHGIWSVRKADDGKRRWTFHPNHDMGAQFTEPNGFIKGRNTTVAGWYRRPSIHMPRWACRITLEITGVRVERLQDISEVDAQAEGTPADLLPMDVSRMPYLSSIEAGRYAALWESINGPGSWDANPWVWVVEFKRVEGGAK